RRVPQSSFERGNHWKPTVIRGSILPSPDFSFDIANPKGCHRGGFSMKKYNVGIIGYGWVATAHIAAINATKQARVSAIYSSRKLDSMELSARHGADIAAFSDLNRMLADRNLDVVSICSYPYDHAKQAVAAARAGKHLIIEKPMALSWPECQAMEAAVRKARVKTCVCFECRYSSQFLATKAAI